ncbi:MAG TPA: hypothetical protein VHK22_01620 [Gaiellaceae bacterium]|nr:hypothetical protein [Gaiellaceae bacterium]
MAKRAYRGPIVGKTYLEHGRPVVVLARWGPGGGPRNVLIEHESGERVVRPFRGLRRPRAGSDGEHELPRGA